MTRNPHAPPTPPLPTGQAVERFAVAMAAASGINLLTAEDEVKNAYRRSAHAALMVFGSDAPGWGLDLGAAHLAAAMDEAKTCLRYFLRLIEGPELSASDEVWIQRIYACATTLERGASTLGPVAEEMEEVV